MPAGQPQSPCLLPSPPDFRGPAQPVRCPPGSQEGKEAAQALGLWVILASLGLGIQALSADGRGVCGLCRAAQIQVPGSPCEFLGKSLLPLGLSFSICQMGVRLIPWFPMSALQQKDKVVGFS